MSFLKVLFGGIFSIRLILSILETILFTFFIKPAVVERVGVDTVGGSKPAKPVETGFRTGLTGLAVASGAGSSIQINYGQPMLRIRLKPNYQPRQNFGSGSSQTID